MVIELFSQNNEFYIYLFFAFKSNLVSMKVKSIYCISQSRTINAFLFDWWPAVNFKTISTLLLHEQNEVSLNEIHPGFS